MRRTSKAATAAALAPLLILGAASCNIADPFEGYRDSAKNLIAASGLGSSDLSAAGHASSGVWTWAWRGATDADDAAGGFDYMTLTPVGAVGAGGAAVPEGLDPAATAYRLELVNLMPNGDFEGAVGGEWAATPAADTNTYFNIVSTGGQEINGKSLYVKVTARPGDNVRFNLGTLADGTASVALHTYAWLSIVNTSPVITYKLAPFDDVTDTENQLISPNLDQFGSNKVFKVLFNEQLLGSDRMALAFGLGNTSDFTLDDVRVVRSDIENRLRLLLKPIDTSPSLVRGYYEFSIWARKPGDAAFVTDAGTAEPYAARSLTVRMLQLSPDQSSAEHSYPLDGRADSPDWGGTVYDASSGWVKLVLRLAEGGNFVFDPRSAEPVLELSLAPYDYAQAEPGVVEIAQPELRFFLNGY